MTDVISKRDAQHLAETWERYCSSVYERDDLQVCIEAPILIDIQRKTGVTLQSEAVIVDNLVVAEGKAPTFYSTL